MAGKLLDVNIVEDGRRKTCYTVSLVSKDMQVFLQIYKSRGAAHKIKITYHFSPSVIVCHLKWFCPFKVTKKYIYVTKMVEVKVYDQ